MAVMIVYVITVIVGETIAIQIGLFLDKALPTYSLPCALALFFSTLFLSWPIAVRITERWIVREKVDVA